MNLAPAPAIAESHLLTGATVHPVSGPAIPNGQVLIKDGKIAAVGPALKVKADKIIKLDGLHLYPGLIAASSSLGLIEIAAVRSTRDTTEVGAFTPEVQAWTAVNPDSELIPVARAAGITHVQTVPSGAVLAGQSGLVVLDGWTVEQMAARKPVAMHLYWPAMELDTTPKELVRDKAKWKSLEDQAKERKAKLKAVDDFFEEARAYAKARDAGGKDFATVPAWEAMLPGVRGEIPLFIHADDIRQIKAAVQWAATSRHRIVLTGGRDAWMAAGLLASNNVPVIYEHVFAQPARDTDAFDTPFKAPALLHQAGVKVTFSLGLGPFAASNLRNLPHLAAQAVAFGLPADEALKGITLYPAELLGIGDRLGSIEPGKNAALLATDGDLLDLRSNVKRLWIAGHELSLESRHTRLYEKYRSRPKP